MKLRLYLALPIAYLVIGLIKAVDWVTGDG
jgi:hypothetical protein